MRVMLCTDCLVIDLPRIDLRAGKPCHKNIPQAIGVQKTADLTGLWKNRLVRRFKDASPAGCRPFPGWVRIFS